MVRLEFDIPDYMEGLGWGLGAGVRRQIAFTLANAHVRAVEGEAKRRAPTESERLRDSIRAHLYSERRGVLIAEAPYAKYLHHGTGIYGPRRRPIVIGPKSKKALHWPGAKHPVKSVTQRGIEPRDFLRLAMRQHFAELHTRAASLAWAAKQPSNDADARGTNWATGYGVEYSLIGRSGIKGGFNHMDFYKRKESADYVYSTIADDDSRAFGFEIGANAYGIIAHNRDSASINSWEGELNEVTITALFFSFSYFGGDEGINPFGKGWHGITWGVGLGIPVGISHAKTNTYELSNDPLLGY